MRVGPVFVLLLAFIHSFAQSDSILSLQIIDANVCFNKKTSSLNFSYYFENHSPEHQVIIDYYEPCIWENIHVTDTNRTLGLVLRIKDDSGKVLLPKIVMDSVAMAQSENFLEDSTEFVEDYDKTRNKNYLFHTRSLRPKDVLMNLYNLKLNRRKCFYKSTFTFDYSRKYTISLYYLAKEDISKIVNYSALNAEDKLFIGELASNEVKLCFR